MLNKFIRNRSDLKVVALCIALATTFWFLKAMNKQYSTNITLPVKALNANNEKVDLNSKARKVKVNVSGYGWKLLFKQFGFGVPTLVVSEDKFVNGKFIFSNNQAPLIADQLDDIKVNYVLDQEILLRSNAQ